MNHSKIIFVVLLFFISFFLFSSKESLSKLDSLKNIKNVVIVSPVVITGGPENLCQIHAELRKLGFNSYVLWADSSSKIKKIYKNNICYLEKNYEDLTPEIYKKNYDVNYLSEDVPLDETALIIIPEVWINLINSFENAITAIAWLSISNIYQNNYSNISWSLIEQKKLDTLGCLHLSQSPWISKTLQEWGAKSFLIGDYISRIFIDKKLKNKENDVIAFYPRKGFQLGSKFLENHGDLSFIRLENLDITGIIDALDSAKIYIDFGHFPGKDRIPREALARDCVIFIHNQGCATDYESFPIDDYFRFSEQDVIDGTLYKKVQEVFIDYENMRKKQFFMRNQILQEYELFEKRIEELFLTR